jgi:hypothetical protein
VVSAAHCGDDPQDPGLGSPARGGEERWTWSESRSSQEVPGRKNLAVWRRWSIWLQLSPAFLTVSVNLSLKSRMLSFVTTDLDKDSTIIWKMERSDRQQAHRIRRL